MRKKDKVRAETVIGIDASRNRSGGAKVHLKGILEESDPREHGIKTIHLWSYKSLLESIPDNPWLVKHNPPALEKGLPKQVFWQYFKLKGEAEKVGCHVMLNTDAGGLSQFRPSIVMSRDMLSYEKGEMRRFGWSMLRIRLILLKYVQAVSLKRATGALFLTKYASSVIQKFSGRIKITRVIPHGIGDNFRGFNKQSDWDFSKKDVIKCIYVSNADMYKHQWHVIEGVASLRKKGIAVELLLVGGGIVEKALNLLNAARERNDPNGEFIEQMDFVRHEEIPGLIANSDIFIFASSCENMPNTLIEGMAVGMPIVCSNRGPMPEVLEDGGLYFDPEKPGTLAEALQEIIENKNLRVSLSKRAKTLSENYSWAKTAEATWKYLNEISQEH